MAAAQSGESRGIVVGRLLAIVAVCGESMPWHHGSAGGHGDAVEEVTAGDVAFHSQVRITQARITQATITRVTIVLVVHKVSKSLKGSDCNICRYILKAK
jgi:hypothetical protein